MNKTYFGIYPGIVEYTNDPLQMGRVLVRVPTVHGELPSELLNWAFPCFPYGGGPGFGSIMIPPEGSSVWVMFQQGDPSSPVYLGSWPGYANTEQKYLRSSDGRLPKGPTSLTDDGSGKDGAWTADTGHEAPYEHLLQSNARPERPVPFKTVKGASVDIDERDESEKLAIHDRSGQALIMESNIKSNDKIFPANENNGAQRGLASSLDGDQLPIESTVAGESNVSLIDINGQSISINSQENNNKVIIISKENKYISEENSKKATLKEVEGESQVTVEISGSENKLVLEVFKFDSNGKRQTSKIEINNMTGNINIESPNIITLSSPSVRIEGDLSVDGSITAQNGISCVDDIVTASDVIYNKPYINAPAFIESPEI